MPRFAPTLAILTTLLMNGSMASAAVTPSAPCGAQAPVCAVSLRMMTPPPPRPADLMTRREAQATVIRAAYPF